MPETWDLFDFPAVPRPDPLRVELRGALRAAKQFVEQNESVPANVMTLEVRAKLISRQIALAQAMRPGTVGEIAQLWSTMVEIPGGLRAANREQAEAIAKRRTKDLQTRSLWAVAEAVGAYRCGEISSGSQKPGTRKPPAGVVGAEADRRERHFVAELADLRAILSTPIAPEPTEGAAARKLALAARMRELAVQLRQSAGDHEGSNAAAERR